MSIFEKRSKPVEPLIPVTKEPSKGDLAVWYGIESRSLRDRFKKNSLCIKNRVLTEGDIGLIFFTLGIPCKLPAELHEWAAALIAYHCRLVPFTAI